MRPYFENVNHKSVPTMLRAALKETTYEKPQNPTTAMANPTGMPRKKRTTSRMKIPMMPIRTRRIALAKRRKRRAQPK